MADPFAFAAMPAPNAGAAAPAYQQPPPQYQQQQQQAPPQQQSQPQYQQQQQFQQPAPQAFNAAPPTPQQQHQQLVVATQPSNPYAAMVAPQPPQQQSQQPQPTPWDIAPSSANLNSSFVAPPPTRASTATAASFDPFAVPVPAPAPPPQPQPPQQQPQQQAYPAPAADPWAAASAARDPWAAAPQPGTPMQEQQQQQQSSYPEQPAYPPTPSYQEPPEHTQKSAYSHVSYEQNSTSHQSGGGGGRQSMGPPPPTSVTVHGGSNRNNGDDRYKSQNARNPYSNMLARQVAGSNCSSLPKAELVGKRGFVLSRISFRTIVMKKWKQSFWIQYGGHTMLWFRSQGDFDDWLNNPYHSQSQRNFLIKLAINFVHDLYKPNVRGYQVTQCRTKPYGNNKAVRQFKLERWMDYGPTIAAAFGSYDAKEVDACREAIVECMKNTPLDNGIRATGAVKEHHDRKQEEEWRKSQEERQLQFARQKGATNAAGGRPAGAYQNYTLGPGVNGTGATRPNRAPSIDFMGNSNKGAMDESASVPPFFGDPGAGALVPAVNPNAAYPGAPPQQPAFYPSSTTGPPQQQQQSYHAPYGAPATQGYPGQPQQPQQQHYPQHAPAPPAFAQQAPAPSFAQPPGGYPQQQQQQQQQPAGYPSASYPVPTHQY